MATFQYAAKDPSGKTVEGVIEAESKGQAVDQLRRQDLVVLRVETGGRRKKSKKKSGGSPKAAKASGEKKSIFQANLFGSKPAAKTSELVIFTRQLATMISAGISLLEALEVLSEQAETPGMKAMCEQLTSELRGGSDLSTAMATCPKVFSTLYISMVTAGEASGQMDVILVRLAEYVEASEELKREMERLQRRMQEIRQRLEGVGRRDRVRV